MIIMIDQFTIFTEFTNPIFGLLSPMSDVFLGFTQVLNKPYFKVLAYVAPLNRQMALQLSTIVTNPNPPTLSLD